MEIKLITVLEALSLWPIVKGDEQKPSYPLPISDWNTPEFQAKVLIHMSVKDNIIPHIKNCKTPKDTWDKLKGLYETSDSNRNFFLKTKLLSFNMELNEPITKYLSCIKDLRDNLGDIGEDMSSTYLVTIT